MRMPKDPAEAVVACLAEKHYTLSTAESCTGGMIAARIVGVPGASRVFPGGAVSYAERIKEELLGVSPQTLARHTVVSRPVAEEMAKGACRRFGTDFALSVTGVAGPDGGTAETPVGRVYVGVAYGDVAESTEHTLSGDREAVRKAATEIALLQIIQFIQKCEIDERITRS